MDDTRPIINFSLSTFDLPNTVTSNNYGSTLNTYKTSFVFNNINLKNIMGSDIWNKYSKFNISLIARINAGIASYANGGGSNTNGMILVMNGLDFMGSRNTTNNLILNSGVICYYYQLPESITIWNSNNNIEGFTNTFMKGNECVNLQFDYLNSIYLSGNFNVTFNGINRMIDTVLFFRIDPID